MDSRAWLARLALYMLLAFFATASLGSAQQVAITFGDLSAPGARPAGETRLEIANSGSSQQSSIVTTLKAEKMPPTYGFVNGLPTEEDPITLAVLKAWRDAGTPLGTHSRSHPDLNDLTADRPPGS